jgi:hypothetical protein
LLAFGGQLEREWMLVVKTSDFTDVSHDASASNNEIIRWAYHSPFSFFSYLPLSRTEIPREMPTTNAAISILNSILNFIGRKTLTNECIDRHFYITLFHHPIENTLSFCRPLRLQLHGSAAKQHKKNPKVCNQFPVHDPIHCQAALAFGKSKLGPLKSPCARASLSHSPLHRKRRSQHHVSGARFLLTRSAVLTST